MDKKPARRVRVDIGPTLEDEDIGVDPAALKRALAGMREFDAGVNDDPEETGPLKRRRVVIPAIADAYERDPAEAIRAAIEPQMVTPLAPHADRLRGIAEWQRRRRDAGSTIMNDPEMQFYTLLKGMLRGEPIQDAAPSLPAHTDVPIASLGFGLGMGEPGAAGTVAPPPRPAVMIAPSTVYTADATPAPISGTSSGATRDHDAVRRADTRAVLDNARAVASTVQVSGVAQVPAEIVAAVESAMTELRLFNPAKFGSADRTAFFADITAMTLLAKLAAACRQYVNITNPREYHFDRAEARRTRTIARLVEAIDKTLRYDSVRRAFFPASQKDQRAQELDMYKRAFDFLYC